MTHFFYMLKEHSNSWQVTKAEFEVHYFLAHMQCILAFTQHQKPCLPSLAWIHSIKAV